MRVDIPAHPTRPGQAPPVARTEEFDNLPPGHFGLNAEAMATSLLQARQNRSCLQ